MQGGGIPIYSVLRSSSSVKILDRKIFIIALHLFYDCGFYRQISLDHLDRIHQRDIVA